MRVRAIETISSPRALGWRRLRAFVDYESPQPGTNEFWLDVPAAYADALVASGDPWLAWLAPLAITLGEPLRIEAPVNPRLLTNMQEVIRIWTTWYPQLHESAIETRRAGLPPVDERADPDVDRTASFFSGGVDSFFTALRHLRYATTQGAVRIDALIFVWGFDIALSNDAAWSTALAANTAVAQELGVPLLPVVTNLRETRFAATDWTRLSHGAALAGVAHALGGVFRSVLIPSSASYRDLRPWGSHPDTDALFTSDRVRIVHDGAEWRRAEKTEYVARSELALRHLRVCYRSPTGTNCGTCSRCYRTMLALEAVGALERCAAFETGALDLRRAERVYCRDATDVNQFGFVRELAAREGRLDIVRAIDDSFRRSSRMVPLVRLTRRLRGLPLFWRWAPAWERRLLRDWVV